MPFKKGKSGNPKGRPNGAKDRVPRSTLRAICAAYVEQNPAKITAALDRAVASRYPDRGLALLLKAEGDRLEITGDLSLNTKVVHEYHPG